MNDNLSDKLKILINPLLILLVGYFCKSEFEDIKAEIKKIPNIKAEYKILDYRVSVIEKKLNIDVNFDKNVHVLGKHEDEITVSNIK